MIKEDLIKSNIRYILYYYDYKNIYNINSLEFKKLRFNPIDSEFIEVNSIVKSKIGKNQILISWVALNDNLIYWGSSTIPENIIIDCIRRYKIDSIFNTIKN